MANDIKKGGGNVIEINEGAIRGELNELVRSTVEETLNDLLDEFHAFSRFYFS